MMQITVHALQARPSHAVRPAPRRSLVVASGQGKTGGIHDPVGWGQGAKSEPRNAGLAAQRELQAEELRRMEARSERGAGSQGASRAAADREIRQLEAEKKADEDYSHLSKAQRTFLRAKELFYEWLKTGVEPL